MEETQQSIGLHETQAAYPYLSQRNHSQASPEEDLWKAHQVPHQEDKPTEAATAREQQHAIVPSSPFLPPPLLLVPVAAAKRPAEQREEGGPWAQGRN